MSESEKLVRCDTHGERRPAYVCQHLLDGSGRGFNWARDPEEPDALCPDAWCDACEVVLEAEGEWTEHAVEIAGIRLLCSGCYEIARERNWLQDDEAFDRLLTDACTYLQSTQDALREKYRLDAYERYDWSQDSGQLVLSQDGKPGVLAEIAFVGSISTTSNTWLWSWANRSNAELVKGPMREVRDFGDARRYHKLSAAHWDASEPDGWDMTAIAAYLLKAEGAYRIPSPTGYMFMIMRQLTWAQ
jgi:hypothetical protein